MISKNKHFVVPYWYPKILYTTVRSFCAPHIQCTLKKNSLIFALFGHLWRPPHPKICIFTAALFFQKWSAHRALRPSTFSFFAKLIFFYVFTEIGIRLPKIFEYRKYSNILFVIVFVFGVIFLTYSLFSILFVFFFENHNIREYYSNIWNTILFKK